MLAFPTFSAILCHQVAAFGAHLFVTTGSPAKTRLSAKLLMLLFFQGFHTQPHPTDCRRLYPKSTATRAANGDGSAGPSAE
jgi:hypothetical protein